MGLSGVVKGAERWELKLEEQKQLRQWLAWDDSSGQARLRYPEVLRGGGWPARLSTSY